MNQVHLIPTAGLCNRMRSIASAVHIAKKLNLPLRIFWNQYEGLNAKFSDLFQPIPVEKTFVEDTQKWKYCINYRKDYLLRRIFLMNYTQVLYNISVRNEENIFSKKKTNEEICCLSLVLTCLKCIHYDRFSYQHPKYKV